MGGQKTHTRSADEDELLGANRLHCCTVAATLLLALSRLDVQIQMEQGQSAQTGVSLLPSLGERDEAEKAATVTVGLRSSGAPRA